MRTTSPMDLLTMGRRTTSEWSAYSLCLVGFTCAVARSRLKQSRTGEKVAKETMSLPNASAAVASPAAVLYDVTREGLKLQHNTPHALRASSPSPLCAAEQPDAV